MLKVFGAGAVLAAGLITSIVAMPTAWAADIVWAGCGITKKAFMAELAQAFEAKEGIKISIEGGGASRGLRDTARGKVTMGGSCRMALPHTDNAELFVELHPVAWDALSVIMHRDNPVRGLSSDQVRGVYTGSITNWKQLGGQDEPIKLYVRRGKVSGVGYAIRQYLFKDSQQEFASDFVVKSSGPLEEAVEKDPHAMGITGISSARKRNVKVIGLDGLEPTFENVRDGKYDLYRPLYLVTGPNVKPEVKQFVAFATSKEGRSILRENGTVPYADAPHLMSKLLVYGFGVK